MTVYGKILLLISVLDIVSTIIGIYFGVVEEANIFMKWHLEKGGILLFGSVKLLITAFGILVFETIWDKELINRALLRKYYLFCIILYIALYLMLVFVLNKGIILKKLPVTAVFNIIQFF